MNMVGVELTNFINPNLTWKTSSKGTKSATRRPRKLNTKSLKVGVEQTDNNPGTENTSISESEKPDVPVLGMRFADKVEHLPIKKRKFLFRSSPPPRTPSPNHGDSEQPVNTPCTSDQLACQCSTSDQQGLKISVSTALKYSSVVDDVNGGTSEIKKEMAGCSTNLSGIEMLAAAACNDVTRDDACMAGYNSDVEEFPARKEMAGPSSTMQSQEPVVCSSKSSHEEDLGASVAILQDTSTSRDCDTEKKTVSSHDDRSLWDLNTVMDAWEQPASDLFVHNQTNATDTFSEDRICCENKDAWEVHSLQRGIGDGADAKIQHIVKNEISLDGHIGGHLLSGPCNLDFCAIKLCRDGLNFDTKANQLSAEERCLPPIESAAFSVSAQTSTQVVSTGSCLDFSSYAGSICTTATFVSEENRKSASSNDIAEKKTEDSPSGMHPGESVGLETGLLEHPDSRNSTLESNLKQESGDYSNATCFHDKASKNDNNVFGMQLGASAGLEENALVEKHDHTSNHASDSRNDTLVANQKEELGDIGNTPCLDDSSSSRTENRQLPAHDAIDLENLSVKSSLQCEDYSASFASAGERLPASTNDPTPHDDKASGTCWNKVDPPFYLDHKEAVVKSSVHHTPVGGDGSSPVEECKSCCDDSPDCRPGKMFDSNVFQNCQDHVVGMENTAELHEGYDSQFEDGEVRESRVNFWEDSEAEYGETEQVDYGSDDEHMYESVDFSAPPENSRRCSRGSLPTNSVVAEITKRSVMYPEDEIIRKGGSGKLEMDIEVDRGLSAGSADMSMSGKDEHFSAIDVVKDSGHSASSGKKMSARDQRPEGCLISLEIAKEVADGNMRSNHLNGSLVRDSESSRRMPSHNEGLSSFHLFQRNHNNRLQPDRSNDNDDYCAQAERGPFGSDRFMGRMRSSLQMQGRHRVGSQWDDHKSCLWNSKRQHSPGYDGRYDSWKPRPRNILENSYAEVEDDVASDHAIQKAEGPDFNWRRPERPMYSPSKGAYPSFSRRRFTAQRDNDNHMYRGQVPAGDFGPDRNRGRPGRFTQRLSPRPGYFKTLPNDSNAPFVHMPASLARRERSFSPVLHREYQHFARPQERYRSSRSRSRSPVMRQFPSERNTGYRTYGRSQDFKTEGRMERVRMPMRKPGFGSDYEAGDMSPPRNRFSPQQRWINDKNNTGGGFKSRRSPLRMFRQNRRFNSPGSPGRRTDDYFRPAQPRRFPDMAFAVRGRKDGAEEDRRKPPNRFDMFQSARFVAHSSHDKDVCITERWHGDDVLGRGGRDERDRQ